MAKYDIVKAYGCPVCQAIYEDESTARTCCGERGEQIVKYRCPHCEGEYDDEDEAVDCCLESVELRIACVSCGADYYGENSTVEEDVKDARRCCNEADRESGWKCTSCGEIYDYGHQARKCCPPEATKTTQYKCSSCGSWWSNPGDAKECC